MNVCIYAVGIIFIKRFTAIGDVKNIYSHITHKVTQNNLLLIHIDMKYLNGIAMFILQAMFLVCCIVRVRSGCSGQGMSIIDNVNWVRCHFLPPFLSPVFLSGFHINPQHLILHPLLGFSRQLFFVFFARNYIYIYIYSTRRSPFFQRSSGGCRNFPKIPDWILRPSPLDCRLL